MYIYMDARYVHVHVNMNTRPVDIGGHLGFFHMQQLPNYILMLFKVFHQPTNAILEYNIY